MSTGADCHIFEKKDGWYYEIQDYPYGETEDYDKHGPFDTFRKAERHLDRNYANPGGWSKSPLPGCKHDLTRPMAHPYGGKTHHCDRCGAHITLEDSNV